MDAIKTAQTGSIKLNVAKQKFKSKLEKINEKETM